MDSYCLWAPATARGGTLPPFALQSTTPPEFAFSISNDTALFAAAPGLSQSSVQAILSNPADALLIPSGVYFPPNRGGYIHLRYPNVTTQAGGGSMTVAMWVVPIQFNLYARVFDFGVGYGNVASYDPDNYVMCCMAGPGNTAAWCDQRITTGGDAVINRVSSPAGGGFFAANTWVHLVFSFAAPSRTASLYKDGQLVGSSVFTMPFPAVDRTFFSAYLGVSNQRYDPYFDGIVSSVQVRGWVSGHGIAPMFGVCSSWPAAAPRRTVMACTHRQPSE